MPIFAAPGTGGGGSGVQSVSGLPVDNTDPNNPVIKPTFIGTVEDVRTALPNLYVGSKVCITTADSVTGGRAIFDVIKDANGNSALSPDGTAFFLNADLYGSGDYSGVFGITGVAPTGQTGVWRKLTGNIAYSPQVTSYVTGLSGTNFTIGDILNGNNGSISELLGFETSVVVTVADTTGMQAGDTFEIYDSGASLLQTWLIDSVIDGTHLVLGTFSGTYLDAAVDFDNYNDTSQTLTGAIINIQYGFTLKVTNLDWAGATTLTNQTAPNDTANCAGISYNNFVVGQNVYSSAGGEGIITYNAGNGTTAAFLRAAFSDTRFNDGDTLTGDTGQIAYELGAITFLDTYTTGQLSVDYNGIYQCIDDTQQNGDRPSNNPAAWYYLDRSLTDVGYILKSDKILGYNLDNDFWKMRWDQENETIINHWSRSNHQWGDTNIRVQITNGSVSYSNLNNLGEIRHTITASHTSIFENNNEGTLVGEIGGGWHSFDIYGRGSNSYLTLSISGADHYIAAYGTVEGNDVITISGEDIAIYANDCYGNVDRVVTAAGIDGYHDYSDSGGERIINSNGDDNISESYDDSGNLYLQMIGASNGYYGYQGSGSVSYYLDNASTVYADLNSGSISGRIADQSAVDYGSNAGTVDHDNISGGFNGIGTLKSGYTRSYNKLSANYQYYILPTDVDYINGEELNNLTSDFQIDVDVEAVKAGTNVVIPSDYAFAGILKSTTSIVGEIGYATETGQLTDDESFTINRSGSDIGTGVVIEDDGLGSMTFYGITVEIQTGDVFTGDSSGESFTINAIIELGIIKTISGGLHANYKFISDPAVVNTFVPATTSFNNVGDIIDSVGVPVTATAYGYATDEVPFYYNGLANVMKQPIILPNLTYTP